MKAITRRIEHEFEIFNSKDETRHPKIIQLDNGEFMLNGSYGPEYINDGDFIIQELGIESPRLLSIDKLAFDRYFEIIEEEKGGDTNE